MRANNFKKIFSLALIASLFFQTVLVFSPQTASAQVAAGGGGSVQTGFDVQGIAASALVCSGVADKMAGLLNGLIGSLIPTTVPTNDPANDTRENCLRMVTKTIINMILDKMTLATVDWISSGFSDGGPLFVEDPEKFFGDIATKEINGVTGWFTCNGQIQCDNYPFGRLVMTSVLTNLQNQAQQNLQFSLNQVLAHGTYEEFRYDFNVGGWAGYTAFLEPQNNPFGNYLLINEDIGRRIGGTSVVTAANFKENLSQSGGFLSPRVCIISGTGEDDYIKETDELYMGDYSVVPPGLFLDPVYDFQALPEAVQEELAGFANEGQLTDDYNELVLRSQCAKWQTTTPGNIVGDQLADSLNIPKDSLIAADDFAENVGLIFNALLNELIESGIKGLSSDNPDSVLLAQVNGQQPGAVANGQTPPTGGDTILGNGPVNIADLPILDIQNLYIAEAQTALGLLDELMKKIRALDYCVPGPNPRWIQSATSNFELAMSTITPSNGLPTEDNQTYYKNIIIGLTGATINESMAMYNHTQFTSFIQQVFNRYVEKMTASYSPNLAPPTARLFLPALFNDLQVYNAELDDLNEYLANINTLLPTIEIIQTTLEDLADANGGVLDPTDPEVQAQVSIFNSIANHLATQTQLNTLIARQDVYEAQILVVDGHVTSCLNETVFGLYASPTNRMPYTGGQIFPYPGLPPVNPSFLPDIRFSGETYDINIEINGVTVQNPSTDLENFEAILQSVY